jgi:uncharacterized protein YjbI with pentapeptide repeats
MSPHKHLPGRDLRFVNLSDAALNDGDFANACLEGAWLRRANLKNADLQNANLRGAHLEFANLTGANLRNTDLTGADLRGARIELAACLDGVRLDRAIGVPDGLRSPVSRR